MVMRTLDFFTPNQLFLFIFMTAFLSTLSGEAKAQHFVPNICDGCVMWENALTPCHCKPHKKKIRHIKKRFCHKRIMIPVCRSVCHLPRARCCYEDCCGNYNPDLTTGDDDPSVYPDLNIDR